VGVYVCVWERALVCVCIDMCAHVCLCACVCLCANMQVRVCECVCVFLCVLACECVCMYACVKIEWGGMTVGSGHFSPVSEPCTWVKDGSVRVCVCMCVCVCVRV
jgi:hypothetical protein